MRQKRTSAQLRLSGILLATGIMSTACNDSVAPLVEPVMAEAGAKKMKVKARLVDINGQPLPEIAKIRVLGWDTTPVWWFEFTDNVKQDDANPAMAEFEVAVPSWDHITVCGMLTPSYYMTDPALGCPAHFGAAPEVDVGDIVMRRIARARFEFLNWKGEPVSGAKLEIKHVLGYDIQVNWDGSPHDVSPAGDGVIISHYPQGTWQWCEVSPPPGHQLASPACGTFDMKFEQEDVVITIPHAHIRGPGLGR